MILKTKKRGLLFDTKEVVSSHIKDIQVVKSRKTSGAAVRIFFKGKTTSGILELNDVELKEISRLV